MYWYVILIVLVARSRLGGAWNKCFKCNDCNKIIPKGSNGTCTTDISTSCITYWTRDWKVNRDCGECISFEITYFMGYSPKLFDCVECSTDYCNNMTFKEYVKMPANAFRIATVVARHGPKSSVRPEKIITENIQSWRTTSDPDLSDFLCYQCENCRNVNNTRFSDMHLKICSVPACVSYTTLLQDKGSKKKIKRRTRACGDCMSVFLGMEKAIKQLSLDPEASKLLYCKECHKMGCNNISFSSGEKRRMSIVLLLILTCVILTFSFL